MHHHQAKLSQQQILFCQAMHDLSVNNENMLQIQSRNINAGYLAEKQILHQNSN